MSYEVTAIRKRPHTFESLVGQEFVVSTLTNSLINKNFAHAYLFSGPHGVGKTSVARILAAALNCEHGPTAHPCCECTSCKEIIAGNSLDVIEIDGASNTSVSDVRVIKDEILFPPNASRYKIYIIDEVHMLSNSAFNALLKTIEEPPEHVIFIFATTEIHKVPATIRSRCQQFNFRLIDTDVIKTLLKDRCLEKAIGFEDDALLWIAKEAAGSMRDAYMLFDQIVTFSDGTISLRKIRENLGLIGFDRINELAALLASGKEKEVLEETASILSAGVSIEQFICDMAEYFRGLLLIKNGIEKESLIGVRKDRYNNTVIEIFSASRTETALSILFSLYRDIRFSLNPRFELELSLSRLSQLNRFLTKTDILEELYILKQQLMKQISLQGSQITIPAVEEEPPRKKIPNAHPPKDLLSASPEELKELNSQTFFTKTNTGTPASAASSAETEIPVTENTFTAEPKEKPLTVNDIISTLSEIATDQKKSFLRNGLSEIKKTSLEGTRIILYCKNEYTLDIIKQYIPLLEQQLSVKTGIEYKLTPELMPDFSKTAQNSESDDLSLFKKVFNAELVNTNPFPET